MQMRQYYMVAVLFAMVVGLANSGGRAFVSRVGNTGAPGDGTETCQNCHFSAGIQTTTEIDIRDGNDEPVDAYIPGQSYEVTVRVVPRVGAPSGYGFQMVALNAPLGENGDAVNRWIDNQANVRLVNLDNGRQYAEHDGVSGSPEFKVTWEAPEPGTGVVSFYAAGNGVNLNGGSSGDGSSLTRRSLEESPPVGVDTRLDLSGVRVGPNPAEGYLRVDRPGLGREAWDLAIYDLWGRRVIGTRMAAGAESVEMNTEALAPGVYILRVLEGQRSHSMRVVIR